MPHAAEGVQGVLGPGLLPASGHARQSKQTGRGTSRAPAGCGFGDALAAGHEGKRWGAAA